MEELGLGAVEIDAELRVEDDDALDVRFHGGHPVLEVEVRVEIPRELGTSSLARLTM